MHDTTPPLKRRKRAPEDPGYLFHAVYEVNVDREGFSVVRVGWSLVVFRFCRDNADSTNLASLAVHLCRSTMFLPGKVWGAIESVCPSLR